MLSTVKCDGPEISFFTISEINLIFSNQILPTFCESFVSIYKHKSIICKLSLKKKLPVVRRAFRILTEMFYVP